MGLTLFNEQINQTYPALIKFGDNQPISGSLKVLSDGQGTDLPVQISTGVVTFTAVVNVQAPTQNSHATTKLYVDTQIGNEETARIAGDANLQTQIDNITAGVGSVISIDGIDGVVDLVEGNEITITPNTTTGQITIAVSTTLTDLIAQNTTTANAALTLATSNLGLINTNTGDIQDLVSGIGNVTGVKTTGQPNIISVVEFAAGNNVTLNQSGQIITINASGTGGAAVDSVNGETGAVVLQSTDLDLLTITPDTGTGQINFEVLRQRTQLEDIKNVTAGTLLKGRALHITGATGNEVEVIYADAASGLAAHLINWQDLSPGQSGKGVSSGFINNVLIPDTSLYPPGTEVYLANNGGFSPNKPTGTSIVQFLGVVFNRSVPSGNGTISGLIQNLGVENQLPNLQQDYIWVGDANGVPQAVSSSTIGTTTTINNNANNKIITGSDTADTLEAEAKFTYDGTNVDIIGAGVSDGLRITGGNIGGAAPSLGLISGSNFNRIDVKTDLVLQNQAKIAFDSDPTNTYIAADAVTPENIQFHADGDLQFYPDNAFEVYTVAVGATKVFNVDSGISNARVSIGYPAVSGPRELNVVGGITFNEDFFDHEDTQSTLTWKGETINLGTAVATTAGRLYYWTGTTWSLADADVLAAASSLLAIATSTISSRGMLINGWYEIQTVFSNGQLYMSPSAGEFTTTQPSTSGQYVRVVGHGTNTNLIRFNPSNDFYEVE